MKMQLAVSATLLTVALPGCNTTTVNPRPDSAALPSLETRVFYGKCVRPAIKSLPESVSIGDIFGAPLISNTLGRVGKALRKAGEADAHPETVTLNLETEPGRVKPCVQIVKARFGDDTAEELKSLGFLKEEPGTKSYPDELIANNLQEARILLHSDPVFFFEGTLRPSKSGTALSLARIRHQLDGVV